MREQQQTFPDGIPESGSDSLKFLMCSTRCQSESVPVTSPVVVSFSCGPVFLFYYPFDFLNTVNYICLMFSFSADKFVNFNIADVAENRKFFNKVWNSFLFISNTLGPVFVPSPFQNVCTQSFSKRMFMYSYEYVRAKHYFVLVHLCFNLGILSCAVVIVLNSIST